MRAEEALRACFELPGVHNVLNIGSGDGEHSGWFRRGGMRVTDVDIRAPADIIGDYSAVGFSDPFDLVWASHVLEHQRNPGAFLEKCRADTKPGGWLAITVPPMKESVVGGHVALFNAGMLLYHLVLAGIDCRKSAVLSAGYNVSVIVRNEQADLPELIHDAGDIERLAHLFPLPVQQGFDGRIARLNWPWH